MTSAISLISFTMEAVYGANRVRDEPVVGKTFYFVLISWRMSFLTGSKLRDNYADAFLCLSKVSCVRIVNYTYFLCISCISAL